MSIEKIINKKFDTLELKTKLINAELQINKILIQYDKLSKNELTIEEIYTFSTYLTNIFNKADKLANIKKTFNVNIETIKNTIELMKSDNKHDKVIGIDNFMSLSHTNSALLPDLMVIINNIGYDYNKGYNIDDENINIFFGWRELVSNKIINILNEIRNRKGLSKFKYEDM